MKTVPNRSWYPILFMSSISDIKSRSTCESAFSEVFKKIDWESKNLVSEPCSIFTATVSLWFVKDDNSTTDLPIAEGMFLASTRPEIKYYWERTHNPRRIKWTQEHASKSSFSKFVHVVNANKSSIDLPLVFTIARNSIMHMNLLRYFSNFKILLNFSSLFI